MNEEKEKLTFSNFKLGEIVRFPEYGELYGHVDGFNINLNSGIPDIIIKLPPEKRLQEENKFYNSIKYRYIVVHQMRFRRDEENNIICSLTFDKKIKL